MTHTPHPPISWRGRLVLARYELDKLRERTTMAIAWKLPKNIAYWAAIRVMTHATTGEHSDQVVPELLAMDALARWKK